MPIPYPRPDISARDDNGSSSIGFKDSSGLFRSVSATDPLPMSAGSVSTQAIANQFPIKNEDTSGATYEYYGYAPRGTLATDTTWVIVRVNKNPSGASGELQRIAVNVAWSDRATATYS